MRALIPILATILTGTILAVGCASPGASTGNPVSPLLSGSANPAGQAVLSQTHLWGYYDVYIDIASQTATATLNRQAMFTANVVNFINGKPMNLGFSINDTPIGLDYVDVDIDVTITHPFPGLPQYNGYDVRGIFMGDGSATLEYNPDLIYPVLGNDQFMLPDPDDGFGGPDGYTRWFNKPEFSTGGMPLFQYTQGKLATPNYNQTATLNPYKYYADGLGASDNLWDFLQANAAQSGVFSSGTTNTRNYYLRFPNTKGVKYSYAVIANWESPTTHPSNAPESIAVSVTDQSDLYYVDFNNNGGSLKLDISVWNWNAAVSGGVMEDYQLFIESTVLSAPIAFSPLQMTPIAGGDHYSTYHFEIKGNNITGSTGNEYWIIAQQKGQNYQNDFGVSNLADTDPLAAIFRFDLAVSSAQGNQDPICNLVLIDTNPVNGWDVEVPVHFDASGSTDPNGDTLSYSWDFDGDGIFGETNGDDSIDSGTSAEPVHNYKTNYNGQACVEVTDGKGGVSSCCVQVQVITHPSKNIPLRQGVAALDLAVSKTSGFVLVLYSDNQVWKYLPSKWYDQSGASMLYNPGGYYVITLDQLDNSFVGGSGAGGSYVHEYSPTGTLLGSYSIWCAGPTRDVTTVPGTGNHANNHCWVFGFEPGNYNISCFFEVLAPTYTNPSNQWVITQYPPYNGYNRFDSSWVVGMEMISNDQFWAVETNNLYAGRFQVPGEPNVAGAVINYNGAYCGTGAQTDADNGFNNPLDLTLDAAGRIFVLDKLSTNDPSIKVFQPDGEPAPSVGSFGNTTNISGDPLRIDGTPWTDPNYGNMMFVLSGSTAPSKLSVFFPSEMP